MYMYIAHGYVAYIDMYIYYIAHWYVAKEPGGNLCLQRRVSIKLE